MHTPQCSRVCGSPGGNAVESQAAGTAVKTDEAASRPALNHAGASRPQDMSIYLHAYMFIYVYMDRYVDIYRYVCIDMYISRYRYIYI